MKIDSAYVGMDSARSYASYAHDQVRRVSLNADGAQGRGMGSYPFSQLLDDAGKGEVEGSDGDMTGNGIFRTTTQKTQVRHISDASLSAIREACILYLLRWLYAGYRQHGYSPWGAAQPLYGSGGGGFGESFAAGGGSSIMTAEHLYAEAEDTAFQARGQVKTSDGRVIDFGLDLSMTRRFAEYMGIAAAAPLKEAMMTDPLVINLDAPAAGLSDQHFTFDIDADGEADSIPMLQSGSGYLALDKNGDGKINDGSELFGTASGDGFKDLSAYDLDRNGWIDENDAVFDKLLIWCRDDTGRDALYSLKEAGVGAICLRKAATDFSLHSFEDYDKNGQIRSTGIFLFENGKAGTMQQLDLAR